MISCTTAVNGKIKLSYRANKYCFLASFHSYQVHEIFPQRFERYPSEDCSILLENPILRRSHEEKISNMISYIAEVNL